MPRTVSTFLMFDGRAEEAMNLYVSLFSDAKIGQVEKYAAGEAGAEGSVKRADFTIGGHNFMCFDSPVKHDFGFTPAVSIFVDCEDEAELRRVHERLSDGGQPLMPLADYGFSRLFGWVNDRFGVSWQLNLP